MGLLGMLLVDHGSRNAAANESLGEIAALVRSRLGGTAIVAVAHMEMARPSIGEGVLELVQGGASEIVVVPYFLAAGRHSTEDIPRMVGEVMVGHAGIAYRVAAPLGIDALLSELVIKRASER